MPSGWRFWPEKEPGPVDDAYVQHRWIRPYRPGPVRVAVSLAVGTVAAYFGFAGYLATLSQPSGGGRALSGLVTGVLVAVLGLVAARVMSAGVWVNDFGVRILGLVHREEHAWSAVADVRRVPGPARFLGLPWRATGETVWLVLADGTDRETAVTDHGPDFVLRPEAYDIAAGAVERWFEACRPDPSA